MYFVYVLLSLKDEKFYTGYTNDLKRRLLEHNQGENFSTKHRRPFKAVYYECCVEEKDAIAREKYLKTGMGKKYLKNRLKYFLDKLR